MICPVRYDVIRIRPHASHASAWQSLVECPCASRHACPLALSGHGGTRSFCAICLGLVRPAKSRNAFHGIAGADPPSLAVADPVSSPCGELTSRCWPCRASRSRPRRVSGSRSVARKAHEPNPTRCPAKRAPTGSRSRLGFGLSTGTVHRVQAHAVGHLRRCPCWSGASGGLRGSYGRRSAGEFSGRTALQSWKLAGEERPRLFPAEAVEALIGGPMRFGREVGDPQGPRQLRGTA